jgi:hypothetical protein
MTNIMLNIRFSGIRAFVFLGISNPIVPDLIGFYRQTGKRAKPSTMWAFQFFRNKDLSN